MARDRLQMRLTACWPYRDQMRDRLEQQRTQAVRLVWEPIEAQLTATAAAGAVQGGRQATALQAVLRRQQTEAAAVQDRIIRAAPADQAILEQVRARVRLLLNGPPQAAQ